MNMLLRFVIVLLSLASGAANAATSTLTAPTGRAQVGNAVTTNFDLRANATLKFSTSDGRVEAGKGINATFALGRPATADFELAVESSQPTVVKVPPRVKVRIGSMGATFAIDTVAGVTSDQTVTIRVSTLPLIPTVPSLTASLLVLREPQVASVIFEPKKVTVGQTAVGTISLSRSAGFGGVTVPLRTLDPTILQLPGSVTIASGSTTGTFRVVGPSVTQLRSFSVETRLGGTAPSGVFQVEPELLAVTAITLPPQVFADDVPAQGRITLNHAVGTQFSGPITLASDNPNVVLAASVRASNGESSTSFNIGGRNVPAGSPPVTIRITATLGNSSQTATTTLAGRRDLLSAVSVESGSVASGQATNGQVFLNTSSQQAVTVALASSSTNLSVPASVTVPAGQTSATFPLSGAVLATGAPTVTATVTATLENSTRTASVRVSAPKPVVASLSVPSTIRSDGPVQTGQVTLAGPSQTDTSVTLQSTLQNLQVPASISIAAGQTTGSFTLTASGLAEGMPSINSTISASTPFPQSPIQRATVTVTSPPAAVTIRSVTFSPPGPLRAPASTTGTVTLNVPAPADGTTVLLGVVQGSSFTSVSPVSVSIPGGSTTGTFQVATNTNILSEASNSPMEAGLGCVGARIGSQASVRGCVSVGK